MKPIDMGMLVRVATAVQNDLNNAELVGMLPDDRNSDEREGYWERAFAVCWRRPIPEGMSQLGTDGYVYATHRVHVNSAGDSACFMGHYDQKRDDALWDMIDRAGLKRA
jgi:hypothetical protein